MQNLVRRLVVIGTGGTIAGVSAEAGDNVGYRAAQLGVEALLAALPSARLPVVETEQLGQVDSKDMSFALWRQLAGRLAHHLARPEVAGVVITHGTDTLEETAYFLQRLLAPAKPVVLTAAMRPATSLLADGPQNLLDALRVANTDGACGVLAVLAGQVHSAFALRKTHPYRLDAFGSGDAGPVGQVEEGVLRQHRPWPTGDALVVASWPEREADWPWIEILTSHAGARGDVVGLLRDAGVDGIVVAATGNGTLHQVLEEALLAAQAGGTAVLRCTRCLNGRVIDPSQAAGVASEPTSMKPSERTSHMTSEMTPEQPSEKRSEIPPEKASPLASAGSLTPVQARVELLLQLLARR